MKRNEVVFIIVLLAIVSFAIGMTQPTKVPFLNFKHKASGDMPAEAWRGALRLDENGVLSGISISAEDLHINGKLTASGLIVGRGAIEKDLPPQTEIPIDGVIKSSSQIFLTVESKDSIEKYPVVFEVKDGSFIVSTNDGNPSPEKIDFNICPNINQHT